MTARAHGVLARLGVLGLRPCLRVDEHGEVRVHLQGPKDARAEIINEARAVKAELLAHLREDRRCEVLAAFSAAFARIAAAYGAHEDKLAALRIDVPDLAAIVDRAEQDADWQAALYQSGQVTGREWFEAALESWQCAVLDALAGLDNVRSGRLCADCGAEAPVTILTGLGQRICSRCARADAPKATERMPRP